MRMRKEERWGLGLGSKSIKMNYNISFPEMNLLAEQVKSKMPKVSIEQMRRQAAELKNESRSKVKKR